MESVIIVDGVPSVGPERLEKLRNVVRKLFREFGTIINECYPMNKDGETKGLVIVVSYIKAIGHPYHAW